MGEKKVRKQNQHRASHHRIGASLAHLYRATLNRVTVKRRDTRNDESKKERLNDAHPEEPLRKVVLQPRCEVRWRNDVTNIRCGISPNESCKRAEHHQQRNHRDETQNFGQK